MFKANDQFTPTQTAVLYTTQTDVQVAYEAGQYWIRNYDGTGGWSSVQPSKLYRWAELNS